MLKILNDNKILVGTHHKTGTVWMMHIFQDICRLLKLKFYSGTQDSLPEICDVFFQMHSNFNFQQINFHYKGIHLIRDPRDRIVSGVFFHQWSDEKWLHEKSEKFHGLSYQEKLNSFTHFDDQLLFEMENAAFSDIGQMMNWNYQNRHFFEAKYEQLVLDESLQLFNEIFRFLGFNNSKIPSLLKIAAHHSLFGGTDMSIKHIRSGKPGEWKKYFSKQHKLRFVELYGNALAELGYELNNDWVDRD